MNQQLTWDAESCSAFRRRHQVLRRKIVGLRTDEADARERWKDQRTARRGRERELEDYGDQPAQAELDDLEFARSLQSLQGIVRRAQEAEIEARDAWRAAHLKRRRAQLDLQEMVASWTSPLPLFDQSEAEAEAEAQPAPGAVVDDPTPAAEAPQRDAGPPAGERPPPEEERDWEVWRVGGPVLGTVRAAGRNAAERAGHEAFGLNFGEMIVRPGRIPKQSPEPPETAKHVEVMPGVTFSVWPDGKGARGAASVDAFGNWSQSEAHVYWPSNTIIEAMATVALGRGLALRDWIVGTKDSPDLLTLLFGPAPYGETEAGGNPPARPGDRSAFYAAVASRSRRPTAPCDGISATGASGRPRAILSRAGTAGASGISRSQARRSRSSMSRPRSLSRRPTSSSMARPPAPPASAPSS